MEGEARRISYEALGKGIPVRALGGEELGTVEHVLQVPDLDVFDGIVLSKGGTRLRVARFLATLWQGPAHELAELRRESMRSRWNRWATPW